MSITYKKRSIKKARTKKKVFGNKKQTYKRSKNKWSLRRKRGGMDKEGEDGDSKKPKISTTPDGSPVVAPTAASTTNLPASVLGVRQIDVPSAQPHALLGAPQPGEQTSALYPPSTPLGAPPPTETDDLCEDELNTIYELLDDINDNDLTSLDDDEISQLRVLTGLDDLDAVVTGDQPDGSFEADEAPKTPDKGMYTRKQVIESLKELLARPEKATGRMAALSPGGVPSMGSFSQEGEATPIPPPQQSFLSASVRGPSSSSAARSSSSSSSSSSLGLPVGFPVGTPEVRTSCSTANFLPVLVLYLNIKRKRWGLPPINVDNCWSNFFDMYEKRGFKPGFSHKIVEYSTTKLFDQTTFSRLVYQQFVIDCVDFGVATEMNKLKNVGRDAFTGEPLKSGAFVAANARGGFLYTSPEQLLSPKKLPSPYRQISLKTEIDWIKECIKKRRQLWIDNHNLREDGKPDGKPDYKASLDDMKKNINTEKYDNWTYWKSVCGICWICKKPIYFYYMTENEDGSGEKINLNTQCGEIEHVLPPTIGDIFGSLHTSASIFKKVVEANGSETMYTYGLEPSHAFCNQMKGMFVFTPILFGRKVDVEWTAEVDSWFRSPRYDSFEFYPGFINTWDGFREKFGGYEAKTYAVTTLDNVDDYLKQNILPILQQQAEFEGHTTNSVTQLKLAIFCQKFAYQHSAIFRKKWDGTESSGAARGR